MSLHDRIKEARKNKGLTQEQLGELIGVAKTTITGYEKNREPSAAKVGEIADVLGVDVNFLFQDEVKEMHENRATHDEFENIIKKYRVLDPLGKEIVNFVLNKEHQRIKQEQPQEKHAYDGFRIINYYQRLASAGSGQFVFDNIPVDMIKIADTPKYKKVKYAIGVNGCSMEPEYFEGDKLLVEPTDTIEYGEIGIFISEGDAFVKKLGTNELISINEDYENIPFTPNTRCVGRVIDKISALDSLSKEDLDTIRNGTNIEGESSLIQNWV